MAAKLFLLLALCVFPVLVTANRKPPFHIVGRVYCDACRAGFWTSKCFYIPGAKVEIQCYDAVTDLLKYTLAGETGPDGKYDITVEDDHGDQRCYVTLVSSPHPTCKTVDYSLNKATVILTRNNGATASRHHANALGFFQDEPAAGCQDLVHKLLYEE
ncbi:Pollen Ole e 1 allergen/extensin [Corchorus olitorius]|uniref:Pollen Ole e 1 allergen/extensin n=1 Tax=Corchorus olitorius TaxID=93759 RepID=A0A1R3KAK2_9ROSI|nr:Pollen Ole e 1 allergen/extensin [Corchorus olitorius]